MTPDCSPTQQVLKLVVRVAFAERTSSAVAGVGVQRMGVSEIARLAARMPAECSLCSPALHPAGTWRRHFAIGSSCHICGFFLGSISSYLSAASSICASPGRQLCALYINMTLYFETFALCLGHICLRVRSFSVCLSAKFSALPAMSFAGFSLVLWV